MASMKFLTCALLLTTGYCDSDVSDDTVLLQNQVDVASKEEGPFGRLFQEKPDQILGTYKDSNGQYHARHSNAAAERAEQATLPHVSVQEMQARTMRDMQATSGYTAQQAAMNPMMMMHNQHGRGERFAMATASGLMSKDFPETAARMAREAAPLSALEALEDQAKMAAPLYAASAYATDRAAKVMESAASLAAHTVFPNTARKVDDKIEKFKSAKAHARADFEWKKAEFFEQAAPAIDVGKKVAAVAKVVSAAKAQKDIFEYMTADPVTRSAKDAQNAALQQRNLMLGGAVGSKAMEFVGNLQHRAAKKAFEPLSRVEAVRQEEMRKTYYHGQQEMIKLQKKNIRAFDRMANEQRKNYVAGTHANSDVQNAAEDEANLNAFSRAKSENKVNQEVMKAQNDQAAQDRKNQMEAAKHDLERYEANSDLTQTRINEATRSALQDAQNYDNVAEEAAKQIQGVAADAVDQARNLQKVQTAQAHKTAVQQMRQAERQQKQALKTETTQAHQAVRTAKQAEKAALRIDQVAGRVAKRTERLQRFEGTKQENEEAVQSMDAQRAAFDVKQIQDKGSFNANIAAPLNRQMKIDQTDAVQSTKAKMMTDMVAASPHAKESADAVARLMKDQIAGQQDRSKKSETVATEIAMQNAIAKQQMQQQMKVEKQTKMDKDIQLTHGDLD